MPRKTAFVVGFVSGVVFSYCGLAGFVAGIVTGIIISKF